MTKQRELILGIINNSKKHLTAEEIYSLAKVEMPTIALATIYNTLNYLTKKGYIKKLNLKSGFVNYDKSIHPHEHCICDSCGKILDAKIADFPEYLETALNTKIHDYELVVHITCEECAKSASNNK